MVSDPKVGITYWKASPLQVDGKPMICKALVTKVQADGRVVGKLFDDDKEIGTFSCDKQALFLTRQAAESMSL